MRSAMTEESKGSGLNYRKWDSLDLESDGEEEEAGGGGPACPRRSPSQVTLYTSKRCPFGRRALIALREKGVAHDVVWVPMMAEIQLLKREPDAVLAEEFAGKTHGELLQALYAYAGRFNPSGALPSHWARIAASQPARPASRPS